MTGIPLVNTNSVNDINTSIIAIKKEMKSSGETEVNVNVNLPDTAFPVDEVTSGNMHSVTSNAVAKAMSYSTSEVNTGKKWIDGKPIYRKVVDCGALPNATYKYVNHNISNLEAFINISVISSTASGSGTMLPYVNPNILTTQISYTYSKTQIELRTATDYSSYINTYAILEYTKTTD